MAKYNLLCTNDHTFEGWFASEKDYLQQKKKKMIACPMCDDTQIRRALMAPNISTKSNVCIVSISNKIILPFRRFWFRHDSKYIFQHF